MVHDFVVKTETFEGPLDLLLNLIEKRKLFINDISLAQVADDYIEHINEKQHELIHVAEFIVIASTLVLIKSKSLLPKLDLTDDEEESIEELNDRLREYQKIRKVAKAIEGLFGKSPIYNPLQRKRDEGIVFAPSADMTLENVSGALNDMVASLPIEKEWSKAIVDKVVSIEEVINGLHDRIQKSLSFSFNDFAGKGKKEKVHVIVHFIALLEMVKQGIVEVRQNMEEGDDITVNKPAEEAYSEI